MIYGDKDKKTKEQRRAERDLKKKDRLIKKTKKKITGLASKLRRQTGLDEKTSMASAESYVKGSRWYQKRRKT